VPPVDLPLLAGERAQTREGLGDPARPVTRDDAAEVVLAAGVAAQAGHRAEAAGGELGELLQRLDDERDVGVHDGGARRGPRGGDALLREHATDRAVMHPELRGDGADAPPLGVEVAEDLRLLLGGDHAVPLGDKGLRWPWSARVTRGGAEVPSGRDDGAAAMAAILARGPGGHQGGKSPRRRAGGAVTAVGAVGGIEDLRARRRGGRVRVGPDGRGGRRLGRRLMRHISRATLAVACLPHGVEPSPSAGALVGLCGVTEPVAAGGACAGGGAVSGPRAGRAEREEDVASRALTGTGTGGGRLGHGARTASEGSTRGARRETLKRTRRAA
jgi:hypothetical protein